MKHLRSIRGLAILSAVFIALMAIVSASAASFFDVQANNPQIAGNPSSNTTAKFPTNKQNEPTIAVNPTNSNFLIAGERRATAAPLRPRPRARAKRASE